MRSPRPLLGVALALGIAAGAVWLITRTGPPAPDPSAVDGAGGADLTRPIPVRPDSEEPYDPSRYALSPDQSIPLFEARVRADPQDYLTLTNLASLYIRKARDDGDHSAYEPAEAHLRRAAQIAPHHTAARVGLAIVACARHRFAESLRLAEELYRESPNGLEPLFIIGDTRLELGQYAEAEKAYQELEQKCAKPPPPAVLARLARLAELRGDPDRALTLLRTAVAAQRQANDFRTATAWYTMRLGEVLWSQGRLDEAAQQLDAALQDHPRYPAALGLLAKLRAAQGRLDDAEELYKRAIGINPNLGLLIDLGDLYTKTGRDFLAKLNYDKVEATARDATDFDRELALNLCNRGRELLRALELAQRDLQARQDVYAYDALAWALLKNDRAAEADEAMTKALRLGTRDAMLFYHAGVIVDRLGQKDRAREYLTRALAINPHFSLLQAGEARQLLARLGGPAAARR